MTQARLSTLTQIEAIERHGTGFPILHHGMPQIGKILSSSAAGFVTSWRGQRRDMLLRELGVGVVELFDRDNSMTLLGDAKEDD